MLGRSFQTPNAIDAGERPASRPSRNRRIMKSGDGGDSERGDMNAHHSYEDNQDPQKHQNQLEEKLVGEKQHGSTSNVALSSRRLKGTKILLDDNDNKSNKEEGLDQRQKHQQQRLPSKDEGVNSDDTEENTKKKKKKKQGKPKEGTDDTEEAEKGEEEEDVDPREYAVKILSEMNEQYEDDATMLSSHSESISSLVNLQVRLLEEKKRWNNTGTGKLCTLLFAMLPSLVLLVVLLLVRIEQFETKYRVLYYIFSVCFLTGIFVVIIMCITRIDASCHEQQQRRQHQNRNNNNNNPIDSDTILPNKDDNSPSSYYSVFGSSMWGTRTHNRRMYQEVPANLAPTRDRQDIEAAESVQSPSQSLSSLSVYSATKDMDSMSPVMILMPGTPSTRNSILSPPAPTDEAAAAEAAATTTTTKIQNNSNSIENSKGHRDEDYDQEADGTFYKVDLGS